MTLKDRESLADQSQTGTQRPGEVQEKTWTCDSTVVVQSAARLLMGTIVDKLMNKPLVRTTAAAPGTNETKWNRVPDTPVKQIHPRTESGEDDQ